MLHDAPVWFVRGLALLDSKLHLRWGSAVGRWVVEREGYLPPQEITFLSNRRRRALTAKELTPGDEKKKAWLAALTEELESAKAGRRVILYATVLDQRIFQGLMERDIQGYGGYNRAIIEIESAEIRDANDAARIQENKDFNLAMEVLDQAEFISRRKQAEMDAGCSWKELLLSGRSSGAKTGIGSLGEYRIIDKRAVQREVAL
jgi:hypothetical protein